MRTIYTITTIMLQSDDQAPISGWAAASLGLAKRRCLEDLAASHHVEEGSSEYEELRRSMADSEWKMDESWPGNTKWTLDYDGQIIYTIFETKLVERVEDMFMEAGREETGPSTQAGSPVVPPS